MEIPASLSFSLQLCRDNIAKSYSAVQCHSRISDCLLGLAHMHACMFPTCTRQFSGHGHFEILLVVFEQQTQVNTACRVAAEM